MDGKGNLSIRIEYAKVLDDIRFHLLLSYKTNEKSSKQRVLINFNIDLCSFLSGNSGL